MKFKILLLTFILWGGVSSCNKNFELSDSEAENRGGLRVTGRIAEMGTKTSFSKEDNQLTPHWKVGDKIIGLWGTDKTVMWRVKSVSNAEVEFKLESGTEPWENGTEVSVIYAPGKSSSNIEGTGDDRTLAFDLSHQDGTLASLGNYSLMTGSGTVNNSSLPLTFSHSIAVISLDSFKDLNPNETYSVKLSGTGMANGGSFVFSEGALTFKKNDDDGEISMNGTIDSDADGKNNNNPCYFAIPAANIEQFKVLVSNTNDEVECLFLGKNVEAGKHYFKQEVGNTVFTITANKTGNGSVTTSPSGQCSAGTTVTVNPVATNGNAVKSIKLSYGSTVTDITKKGSFEMPNGSVTVNVEFGEGPGYPIGKLYQLLGIKILKSPQNPGLGEMWWAPVNCGYDESHPYGRYYEYGRKYGQAVNGTNNVNVTTKVADSIDADTEANKDYFLKGGNVYDPGFYTGCDNVSYFSNRWKYNDRGSADPCPDGWRIPCYGDTHELFSYGSKKWENSDGINGMWFSTENPYNAESENRIFLPAAGQISYNNGSPIREKYGTDGVYYFITYGGGDYSSDNKYGQIDITNTSVGGGSQAGRRTTSFLSNFGYSIRCIKDD